MYSPEPTNNPARLPGVMMDIPSLMMGTGPSPATYPASQDCLAVLPLELAMG